MRTISNFSIVFPVHSKISWKWSRQLLRIAFQDYTPHSLQDSFWFVVEAFCWRSERLKISTPKNIFSFVKIWKLLQVICYHDRWRPLHFQNYQKNNRYNINTRLSSTRRLTFSWDSNGFGEPRFWISMIRTITESNLAFGLNGNYTCNWSGQKNFSKRR